MPIAEAIPCEADRWYPTTISATRGIMMPVMLCVAEVAAIRYRKMFDHHMNERF